MSVPAEMIKKGIQKYGLNGNVLFSSHTNPELEDMNSESSMYSLEPNFVFFGSNEENLRSTFYDSDSMGSWAELQLERLKQLKLYVDKIPGTFCKETSMTKIVYQNKSSA